MVSQNTKESQENLGFLGGRCLPPQASCQGRNGERIGVENGRMGGIGGGGRPLVGGGVVEGRRRRRA